MPQAEQPLFHGDLALQDNTGRIEQQSCSVHPSSAVTPTAQRYGILAKTSLVRNDAGSPGRCSGSHYLHARLAIEHPSRPTIIDSGTCSRPILSAPEPTLLILGSQSSPTDSYYLRAQLYGEFFMG